MTAQLTDIKDIATFLKAGKATFTLVSKKTGTRFTFKVAAPKGDTDVMFASVLNGPDNWENYAYMGLVNSSYIFRRTVKSKVSEDAPSFKAFKWFWGNLFQNATISDQVEFWHEGKCGACGRKLTVPSSIEQGLGPVCADRAAGIVYPVGGEG